MSPAWRLVGVSGFLLISQAVLAGPAAAYYDTVDDSDPVALRATLHEVIDDHTRYPYTSSAFDTWDILELADEDPNDSSSILDVYKNASYPQAGGGNAFYNREHTWPKSYGFPDDNSQNYPYTDTHSLFLSDSSYNSSRSNNPYRYCDASCLEKPTLFNNGQGGPSIGYPGNSNWRSGSGATGIRETWVGRRGDVARALFYLDVRYEGDTHGITGVSEPDLVLTDNEALIAASVTGNNEPIGYMGMLSVLIAWHAEDPVDDMERWRNDIVYTFQGNRNPFIDHPEWADCIFAGVSCGGLECTLDPDCDDTNVCTLDTCTGGSCSNSPIDCSDTDACTADSCVDPTGCQNDPITCDDGDPCTVNACDPASGCTFGPLACPPDEICVGGLCRSTPSARRGRYPLRDKKPPAAPARQRAASRRTSAQR